MTNTSHETDHVDRPRPIALLEDVRSAHNVVAAVRHAREARSAIEALERGGVEASRISLLGSHPAGVEPASPRRGVARVGRLFGAGLGLGAIAGMVIGWMADIGGSAAPVLWAVFGAIIGGFVVAVSSFGVSMAWWRTFTAERSGTLAVGVHTPEPTEADLAEQVLGAMEPLSINRF